MPTNHFSMALVKMLRKDLDSLGILSCDFLSATRLCMFDESNSPDSKDNFAEACNIISELLLPRSASLATISFSAQYSGDADIRISFGSTSKIGDRDYMRTIAADAEKALLLYDRLVKTAASLNLSVA